MLLCYYKESALDLDSGYIWSTFTPLF